MPPPQATEPPGVEVFADAETPELEGPIATMAAAAEAAEAADSEPTIALETPTKSRRNRASVDVATVPESRRALGQARREQSKTSKAERAAVKADRRSGRKRKQPADLLVAKIPGIKPAYAAMLTGVLSGLLCVLLAKGASVSCEAIRSNGDCGGGIGLLALVAILAIEVMIGANLLKAFRVSDPVSTSFLGVGLVAMITMLFFLDDSGKDHAPINSPKMIVIIPLITAVTFLLSWWVTVRFVEDRPEDESTD